MEKEERAITLREVVWEDRELLFGWKNDPETIANSTSRRGVTLEEHENWLKAVLQNPNRWLYLMEVNGIPAGQLRLDVSGKTAEISYGMDEKFRGQGLGRELLLQAERIAAENGLIKLTAEVLPHNKVSQELFRKLGYQEEVTKPMNFYAKALDKGEPTAGENELF